MTTEQAEQQETGAFAGYSQVHTPLGGYSVLMTAWGAVFGGLLPPTAMRHRLPERIESSDIALLGVATHKLARIVTKDWVTVPLRAPFVRYRGSAGGGEVTEKARGRGMRKTVGDLLTCPWCIGPWVAGALVAGLVARPRATRVAVGTFAAVAASDFLHEAYLGVKSLSS